jgi:hypothetical protein
MIASPKTSAENDLDRYISQHDKMLRYCMRIADLDIPAILRLLTEIDAALGECSGEIERFRARRLLEDNLAIARLALEIQTEVNRRSR